MEERLKSRIPSWNHMQFSMASTLEYSMADQLVPGFLSEIADGDAPHRGQGCPAQAWSMTEFCRVARLLEPNFDIQREDEENG